VVDQDGQENDIDIAVRGDLSGMRAVWRGVGDWSREEWISLEESE
jgi:hypothetical protein